MADSFVERMRRSSHLSGGNAAYIESLYESFLNDPGGVAEQWSDYFDGLPRRRRAPDIPHSPIIEHFGQLGRNRLRVRPEQVSPEISNDHETKQVRVLELIAAYRSRGHRRARLDPLGVWRRGRRAGTGPCLPRPFDRRFSTPCSRPVRHISLTRARRACATSWIALERTYCTSIGVEYMHIADAAEQLWVCRRVEAARTNPALERPGEARCAGAADGRRGPSRKYLHAQYPGTKRFSLEGADSLIPMLHETLQRTGAHGVVETVIGMAHRGRLNVLVNILGKDPGRPVR